MRALPMNAESNSSRANRQIARAAGTVMVAIVLGQVLGLIRGVLVARAFPAAELDAFFAANRVSETLFVLIAAGALGSAFIPTFTGMLARGDGRAAWRLASALGNLILLILSALAALAAIFAPSIVRYLLAPGFSANAAQFDLTVQLLRVQLASVVLFGLGGLIVGILNAQQVFFVPALTPSMYQLGLIFGVLFLGPRLGIRGLAWGVVIGAALYLLLQLPALFRLGQAAGLENRAPWYTRHAGLAGCGGSRGPATDAAPGGWHRRRAVEFLGEHLDGLADAERQRRRATVWLFIDADGAGRHRAVGGHRRHADLLCTACIGQT